MRKILLFMTVFAYALCASPALASLPHYNADIGYTIWLPKSWDKAPESYLDWADSSLRPVPVQGERSNWQDGYLCPEHGKGPSLLVEVKHGRKMHAADISNFNSFLVRSLTRRYEDVSLKDASYIEEKRTLRLEAEMVHEGEPLLSLTYVVYTRIGILTFVGYVDPADTEAKATIDKAVLSLYLDDSIRY